MRHRPYDRDRLTLFFLYRHHYLRVRYQSIGSQHFRNLLLHLHFRQARHVQPYRNQRQTDRPALANPKIPRKFWNLIHFHADKIPSADHIVVRLRRSIC